MTKSDIGHKKEERKMLLPFLKRLIEWPNWYLEKVFCLQRRFVLLWQRFFGEVNLQSRP